MQTIYIDVYFLINFSIDALALYFAIRVSKMQGSLARLILASVVLSLGACIYTVFFYLKPIGYLLLFFAFSLGVLISIRQMNIPRFFKLALWFLLFLFLIGGVVHYAYGVFSDLLEKSNIDINYGAENRKYLLLAAFVLLAIGIVRLFILLYESTKHLDCVTLSFVLFDKKYELRAMIDSGNLLKDPLTCVPVVLVKERALALPFALYGDEVAELDYHYKKQLRVIPTRSLGFEKMLYGFYLDQITLYFGKKQRQAALTIAIDPEGGTYGGFDALAPSQIAEYDS